MKKILFVCTGNTCRSPMAMAFFNYFAGLEPPEFEYEASSAGLAVSGSPPASTNTVLAMEDPWGIDITQHRAHLLSQAEVEEAFLLLTMTRSHKHYILSIFPAAYQKVFTLKEYSYDMHESPDKGSGLETGEYDKDISDPYGSSLWSYKLCAQEIMQAVKKLVEKLKKS